MQNAEIYENLDPISSVPKKKSWPNDPIVSFVFAQTLICLVAFVVACGLRLLGGDVYTQVRNGYQARFCDTTSVGEVVDVFGHKTSSATQPLDTDSSVTSNQTQTEIDFTAQTISPSPQSVLGSQSPVLMNTTVSLQNRMIVPLQGEITSPFGYRIHPIYQTRSFHNGVDIGADTGTDIAAAMAGEVEIAVYDDSYGNYVVLHHGNEIRTVYAHCCRLTVEKGEWVDQGQTVGLVGSTGVSTGPHLHFEVRRGEHCINPQWLIDFA